MGGNRAKSQAAYISDKVMIVNGSSSNSESLTDAVLLGDGVFETLRTYENRTYGFDRHIERLRSGLVEIGIANFDLEPVVGSIKRILIEEALPSGALRIACYADGGYVISHKPFEPKNEGIRCAIHKEVGEFKRFKSASYSSRLGLRRLALQMGFDDVITIDESGIVGELSTSNLLLHIDGEWVTPDLKSGCLPGVTRGFLIENFGVRQAHLSKDEIESATAAAAVSSLREVQQIKAIDGKDFAISKELRELQESFSAWVLGNLLS